MDLFAFLDGGEMAIGAENRGEGECAGWDAVLVHFRVEGDGMGETLTTVREAEKGMGVEGLLFFSSHQNPNSKNPPSSPWLHKWPSPNPKPYPNSHSQNAPPPLTINTHKPHSAIERIVHRLRDLGLGSDDDNDDNDDAEQRIHDREDKFSDLLD
ncbi:hypothetical protein MRB53_035616 [Persea americana]|uniref:Uncharacterized protein n=1 Tax=Persea americana TaxID=3435 RepID=A0ACC2K5J9_PERAE|nr:hypothetical protein MRB53_035616 [Persea americana]